METNPFEKAPYLEVQEIRREECSQLLVNLYSNNPLEEDKEGVNLLIATYIRSPDLLSPSEFCKIRPLVVNLFPVKPSSCPVQTEKIAL